MAVDIKQFDEAVQQFNSKYQTNFSLSAFTGKAKAMKMVGGDSFADIVYKSIFAELAKQMLQAKSANKLEGRTLLEMLNDYENIVMRPYRHACKEAGDDNYPKAFGGLNNKTVADYLSHIVENTPKTQVDVFIDKYKNGEIRIRDLVEKLEPFKYVANQKNVYNIADIPVLAAGALGLEQINRSRSFLWKVFHPFRNHAEQRDAALIRQVMAKNGYIDFNKALENADKKFEGIAQEEQSLERAKQAKQPNVLANENNQQVEQVKEDKFVKGEITVNIKDKKGPKTAIKVNLEQLAESDVFKIGYRPSAKNLTQDIQTLKIIAALKTEHGIVPSGEAAKILKDNKERVNMATLAVNNNGKRLEVIADVCNQNHTKWNAIDMVHQNKFSDDDAVYEVKFEQAEKVKVNVELNDNAIRFPDLHKQSEPIVSQQPSQNAIAPPSGKK